MESGVLRSEKHKFEDKLLEIGLKIEQIIEEFSPQAMAIEDVFRGANVKTALKSAHLKGLIIYIALKNNIKVKTISPAEVKDIITGYGRATKEQVMSNLSFFAKNIPSKIQTDESDAIAIAISYFFL